MTNKEKAHQIAYSNKHFLVEEYLMEMAEWKDQQFKEYLESRKRDYINSIYTKRDMYDDGYIDVINEIIDELFGEEEK